MNIYITDDDIFTDSLAEIVNLISILSGFLLINQKFVIANRLKHFSADLNRVLLDFIRDKANNKISIPLFIKSGVAIEECLDYLTLINDLGYYDTSTIIKKINILKNNFLSWFENSNSSLDFSSIQF
jgi:hypothetical protein